MVESGGRDGLRTLARLLALLAVASSAWLLAGTRMVGVAGGCGWDGASYCAMSGGAEAAAPFSHRVLVPWLAHLVPGLSPALRFEVVDGVGIALGAALLWLLVARLAVCLGAPRERASAAGLAAAALSLLSPWTVHVAAWAPVLTDPVANALLFGWMLAVLPGARREGRPVGAALLRVVAAALLAAAAVLAREAALPLILVGLAALLAVPAGRRRDLLARALLAASAVAALAAGVYADTRPSLPSAYSTTAEISQNLSAHFSHLTGLLRLGWMVVFAAGLVPAALLGLRRGARRVAPSWRGLPAEAALLLGVALATAALSLVGGSDTSRLLSPGALLLVGATLAVVAARPVSAVALWASALATLALWQPWRLLGPEVGQGEDFFAPQYGGSSVILHRIAADCAAVASAALLVLLVGYALRVRTRTLSRSTA